MLKIERDDKILAILEKNHSASVHKLASKLFVSEATIRRDLNRLEKSGLIKRVFGGAMLTKYANLNVPLTIREQENRSAKLSMAQHAAEIIRDRDVIIIDASSSAQMIVPFLKGKTGLTVITNCTKSLELLHEMGIKTFCTGGALIGKSMAFSGWYAEQMISDIKADLLFFSCQGLSLDGRLSDSSNEETRLRQTMFRSAVRKILLCDSSKIGKSFMFRLCNLSDIDDVISDTELPAELTEILNPQT